MPNLSVFMDLQAAVPAIYARINSGGPVTCAHQLGGLVKMLGELFHGQDVAANEVGIVVATLEVFQHSLS